MRILHLGKFYPPAAGGIEMHVRTLARAQAALGASVTVLCINHLNRKDVDVTDLRLARTSERTERDGDVFVHRVSRWAQFSRMDFCPALRSALRRHLKSRPDVVHLHTPNPAMTLGLASVGCRGALVVTHHSDIVRQRWLAGAFAPIERHVYNKAVLLFADSDRYAQGSPLLSMHPQKLRVLPLGLPLEPFLRPDVAAVSERQRLRAQHGEPLWLSVGRLVYYKGLETGLKALRHLPGRWMVAGMGPELEKLKSLAAQLGVSQRVIWAGHLPFEKLVGAYLAATALWFPSNARSEGFGQSQVEAMAAGCPVINTDIPNSGVSWVSVHGESGLTIPVGDEAALAAASRRLLDEPGLRQGLGLGARARAVKEFEATQMARRSFELYGLAASKSAMVSGALAAF